MTEQLSVSLDNLIQKLVSEVRELYRETRLGSLHGAVMELSSDHFSSTAILGFKINSHSPVALFPVFFFFFCFSRSLKCNQIQTPVDVVFFFFLYSQITYPYFNNLKIMNLDKL